MIPLTYYAPSPPIMSFVARARSPVPEQVTTLGTDGDRHEVPRCVVGCPSLRILEN